MPLFGGKKKKDTGEHSNGVDSAHPDSPGSPNSRPNGTPVANDPSKPKLLFHCQQAQGSPTGIISGFTNIKELYQKIAECYDFDASEILFCTLNTHKVDMTKLLGGQIGLDDFIFVHRKGQVKEVEIAKTEDTLGLTITDNAAGCGFIKRIKEGSLADRIGFIQVGDHIQRIDSHDMVGCRHFEVAKALKDIPKGTTFTMRLVEPLRAGFSHIGPRGGPGGKKPGYGTGKETLRLRSKGPATIEEAPDDIVQAALDRINGLLESFMGINDTELATQIWEFGRDKDNPHNFVTAIDGSDLEAFGFTDDFIYDLWGAINDAKSGRLKKDVAKTSF